MSDYSKGKDEFLSEALKLHHNKNYLEVAEQLDYLGQKRIIYDRESNEPYLIRYYYKNYRPFCRLVLHRVLKSDVDGLHDHPWNAQTYILSGGYWETVLKNGYAPSPGSSYVATERLWRPEGYHANFSANHFHRLELDYAKSKSDTWTLFMMGPAQKEWGFLHNGDWIHHEKYISMRAALNGISKN